jgi:hypothetical protein
VLVSTACAGRSTDAMGVTEDTAGRFATPCVCEHVSLHREPRFSEVARPLDAAAPGERRGTAISGYGSQLAQLPIRIVSKRLIECRRRINVPG